MALPATGARAYLDIEALIAAAKAARLRRHPSRLRLPRPRTPPSPAPAPTAKIAFIGPSPEALEAFGDKASARALAATQVGVPVIAGTEGRPTWPSSRPFSPPCPKARR